MNKAQERLERAKATAELEIKNMKELFKEAKKPARTVCRAAVGMHIAVVLTVPAVAGKRRITGKL